VYIKRIIPLKNTLLRKSVLLFGARRSGKTSLIANEVNADLVYNLLEADQFQTLLLRPSLIREQLCPDTKLVVIDEIQKLPQLMNEVHSMIESKQIKFLLSGSSARKLRRTHTSLMAGRAKQMQLFPFVYPEI
jgi:uncharacterized protein